MAIAATFVTLSWNTSQSLSRDFILQVENVPAVASSSHSSLRSIKNPILQYSNIEVSHKMNSYTISDLLPSTTYNVLLCLQKTSHVIPVSVLRVTTRPESYMHQLGINKDYTALTAVVVVLGMVTLSCISLTIFRLYRFKYSIEADSLSTKEMIISPSEPDSLLSLYIGPQIIQVWDNRKLIENEVASPQDELGDCGA